MAHGMLRSRTVGAILLMGMLSGALTAEDKRVIYLDMNSFLARFADDTVLQYDALKTAASLQGLANRERPRLLLRFLEGEGPDGPANLDDFWLDVVRQAWMKDYTIERHESLTDVLKLFSDVYRGWVHWDPAVPATANVAATVCGVEGLLPLRANSPFIKVLRDAGIDPQATLSLVGRFDGSESGSAKCDAYLWAKREYLEAGKCHPALMAYYIDGYTQRPDLPGFHYPDLPNTCLPNHDYFISHAAFFFDLNVWGDEAPVDDPGQPIGTDRRTFKALLQAQYRRNGGTAFTSVGGFVPWNLKYTNYGPAGGKRDPVPTEWEHAALLSAHNALKDADALALSCLTNASAYRHFPLRERYTQHARPPERPLEEKTYVLIYMGDYDSAAWMARCLPSIWNDPARGSLPIAWAFNPNLSDRVPHIFDYLYRTASANDWFIGGNSGAGYVNPNLLIGNRLGSGLPDALHLWEQHNIRYYRRFDYSITGFVINGFHGDMPLRIQEAYARFSPGGVGMQLGFEQPIVQGTPFLRHASDIYPDPKHPERAAAQMAGFATPEKPQFLIFRWILHKPSTQKAVRDALKASFPEHAWEFCDPYTFFNLYRRHVQGEKPG